MSYAVICDARMGKSEGIQILALVDRSITTKKWWTDTDPSIILKYTHEAPAEYCASRLKENNPRVVPYQQAVNIIHNQKYAAECIAKANEITDVGSDQYAEMIG